MAVKFYFPKDRYGIEGLELKRFTLFHGGTFRQRREILISIYALFKVLEYVREGKFADDLWEEVAFEYTSIGKQVPFCISIEAEGLARALETLYRCFAEQLVKEWLGYSPLLPKLELIPEHTDRVFVGLNKGESIQISFEGENRESSGLAYFIDDCGTFSFRGTLAECIMDVFDEVFMKTSSEFYSEHTGAVYFPVERQKLSEIDKPLNVPDWKKVKTESIGYFCDMIGKHFIKQFKPESELVKEFVKKCAVPVALMWTLRGFPFKGYEEFASALLDDRKFGFTEEFVPVLIDEEGDIPLSKAEGHVKDTAYLLAALDCLSMKRLFVEDVDRHKDYEHQDIMKMLFDELLGFDRVLAHSLKRGVQLFATCEGDYLPWQFEDYDRELTGIYKVG